MLKILYLLILAIAQLQCYAQEKQIKVIDLSRESSITIDGKIEEKEWQQAIVHEMENGGKVYFKYDGTYIYVGVNGMKNGWSQVYLTEGESSDVAVIHASAALAKTLYKQDVNKNWQPSNPFLAELRDRTLTMEAKKKMDDYLNKNNWVANNIYMGNPAEIEFKIKPQNISNKVFYIGVVWVADSMDPQFFPNTLADDTVKKQRLVEGWMPPDVKFAQTQWAKIILQK